MISNRGGLVMLSLGVSGYLLVALMLETVAPQASPAPTATAAPAPTGLWRADDGTSVIEIKACGDALCGHLIYFLPVPGDPKVNAQLCNLKILGDFKRGPKGRWTGGWIFSPEDDGTYSSWLEPAPPDRLLVRAFVKIEVLGETVTWRRHTGTVDRCAPAP